MENTELGKRPGSVDAADSEATTEILDITDKIHITLTGFTMTVSGPYAWDATDVELMKVDADLVRFGSAVARERQHQKPADLPVLIKLQYNTEQLLNVTALANLVRVGSKSEIPCVSDQAPADFQRARIGLAASPGTG
ncbi:MAG: hypothetical protein Q9213_003136 [Squamulea squamosa]